LAQRIYVICPWFDIFAGGAEKALRELAEMYVRFGMDVHVLTTCSVAPYKDWFNEQHPEGSYERDGLTVSRFAVDKDMSPYHAANVKLIGKKSLTNDEKDAFFTKSISSQSLIRFLQTNLTPADRILCGPYFQGLCHNVVRAFPGRVHLLPAFHDETPFYWPPVTQLLDLAAGVFFLSYKEKDLVIEAHGARLGLSFQDWPVIGLPITLPNLGNTNTEKSHILYIGRFDHGKGVPQLCEWHAAYADTCAAKDAEALPLKLVGSGDATAIIEHDSIDIVGFVDDPTKQALIENAIAVVNLSPNESFSYVVMEAGASGVPVIVSDKCDVTADHVAMSEGGWSLSSKDEYIEVLELLRTEPSVGLEAGKQARAFIETAYHRDRIDSTYLRALLA